jgi:hypothetical protein
MTTRQAVIGVVAFAGLVVLFAVLLMTGTALFPVDLPGQPRSPAEQQEAARGLVVIAIIDVAILLGIARSSRLRGWRLWLLLTPVLYGVMTFTSQLEAAYFMKNVTRQMLPNLFAMTLPLALLLPPALVAAFGLWRPAPDLAPAWRAPEMKTGEFVAKLAILAVVVYPVLFFGAGYYIAWQSPVVREFYSGSTELRSAWVHYRALFGEDPVVFPFEVLRGLLWIAFALPVLRTTRGPAWLGTLHVALLFCLVQNNLHLLPNPLMPAEVRLYHFVETGSSNTVWALAIGWLLQRSHLRVPAAAEESVPGALRAA